MFSPSVSGRILPCSFKALSLNAMRSTFRWAARTSTTRQDTTRQHTTQDKTRQDKALQDNMHKTHRQFGKHPCAQSWSASFLRGSADWAGAMPPMRPCCSSTVLHQQRPACRIHSLSVQEPTTPLDQQATVSVSCWARSQTLHTHRRRYSGSLSAPPARSRGHFYISSTCERSTTPPGLPVSHSCSSSRWEMSSPGGVVDLSELDAEQEWLKAAQAELQTSHKWMKCRNAHLRASGWS